MDINDKLLIVATSVGLSFIISQLIDFIKYGRNKIKKINSIYSELLENRMWTEKVLKHSKYSMLMILKDEKINTTSCNLHTFMFEAYYKEVGFYLRPGERVGFIDVYDTIQTLNALSSEIGSILQENENVDLDDLFSKNQAVFLNAYSLAVIVDFMLENRKKPKNTLVEILKDIEKIKKEHLDKIVIESKVLSKKEIEIWFYDLNTTI